LNILLSHPRSGNTWLRYYLEYVSLRPSHTGDINQANNTDLEKAAVGKKLIPGLNCKKRAICTKRHHIHLPKDEWTGKESIILIVRDYKECILKHLSPKMRTENLLKENIRGYTRLLRYYDEHKGKKILVYYEDLMTHPRKELSRIKDFLDLDDKRHNEFMDNYNEHKEKMLKHYHGGKVRFSSRGEKFKFHQRMAESTTINSLKSEIRIYRALYNKYLKRYA